MRPACDWWLRVLWIVGLVGSVLWAWVLFEEFKERTTESESDVLHARDIPFPSVTICSQIKFKEKAVQNLSRSSQDIKFHVEEAKNMVCTDNVLVIGKDTTDIDQSELIAQIAPQLDEVMPFCSWGEESPTSCNEYFNKTFTSEGLCFNFNMLGPEDMFDESNTQEQYWTPENGYHSLDSNYPRRWDFGGISHGLRLVLVNQDNQHDHKCRGPLKGLMLQIHSPNELPLKKLASVRIPPNQEVVVGIEPEWRVEKSDVGCVKRGMRKLEGFREYTRNNCKFNCMKKYMKRDCKCLPFWLKENGYPLCSVGKKKCTTATLALMERQEDGGEAGGLGCNCLPQCVSISYKIAEIMQSPFYWNETINAHGWNPKINEQLKNVSMSRVVVYTKDVNLVYPVPHNPVIIYRHATSWVILSLLGLCLLIFIALLFRLSQEPSRSPWNSAAREESFTEVSQSGNTLSEY